MQYTLIDYLKGHTMEKENNINSYNDKNFSSMKISKDVIATAAKLATLEIDGVSAVSTTKVGMNGILNKVNQKKPVKVDLKDDVLTIEISVIVDGECDIPKVCETVQQNIKGSVQSMTGLAVSNVDVIVCGISEQEVSV